MKRLLLYTGLYLRMKFKKCTLPTTVAFPTPIGAIP